MKADKIFWGIIFVFVGGIFLLENFNVIDFSWGHIWRFWPLLLIISGVNIIFARSSSKISVIAMVVITVAALAFICYEGLNDGGKNRNHIGWVFSDRDGNDWDDSHDPGRTDNVSNYSEDFDAKIKNATLNIYGGASAFQIENGNDRLFESRVKESITRYFLKRTDTDSTAVLEFRSKKNDGSFNFKDDEYGKVKMKINTQPLWDVNLKMGAGKADFDFSQNKVHNISLKGGAAEFDVKLGNLYNDVNLSAETGLADVNIQIPTTAGCKILVSSGLSSKTFKGFIKMDDGSYESPNFKTAAQKIHITLKGGLSNFEVNRY
ncbi:hypothetical protein I5M32_04170 [Pedobacter sp. SD-b]|uniref:LiaI-LiaF-like transmembrane region domain-containing protein n=1 Tax=Pedobacter segetis TaxID=2793069 RepID=A0ABS1BGZ8_9SPHI|nr:DUF5668 domain-containing protein [Pedobacter segetis]MBK0382147.1 hypothetical protein [Pedobacter segetis]